MRSAEEKPAEATGIQRTSWWRRLLAPAIAGGALACLLGGWAMSTAPGGVPDDQHHQALIWCGWGQSESCGYDASAGYLVPAEVGAYPCFIRKPATSATCVYTYPTGLIPAYGLVVYGNEQMLSGMMVYHRVMRLFVGNDPERSIVMIRLANALLAGLFLGLTLAIVRRRLQVAVAAAWLVCLVPIGTFIIPSANPSSWTVIGIGTFWALFLHWITSPKLTSRSAMAGLVGALCAAALALLSRSDGAMFLGVSVVAVALLAAPALREYPRRWLIFIAPLPFVAIGVSLRMWVRLQASINAFVSTTPDTSDPVAGSIANQWVNHALEFPTLIAGIVGYPQSQSWPTTYYLGLGYLDVAIPSITAIVGLASIAAILLWGWQSTNVVKGVSAALVLVLLVVLAYLPPAFFHFSSGSSLQTRHLLPALMLFVGISCLAVGATVRRLALVPAAAVTIGLTIANSAALLLNLRHYTNGEAVPYFDLSLADQWWWQTTLLSGSDVWIFGTVAGACYFIALTMMVVQARRPHRAPSLGSVPGAGSGHGDQQKDDQLGAVASGRVT